MRKFLLAVIMILTLTLSFAFAGCGAKESNVSISDSYKLDKIYDGKQVTAPTVEQYETDSNGEVVIEWFMGSQKLDSAPIDAGNYKLKITIGATKKHLECSVEKAFTISKVQGVAEFTSGYSLSKAYDGVAVAEPVAENYNTNAGAVSFEWYKGDTKLTEAPVNVGEYKIKLLAKETKNYTSASATLDFEISKATGKISLIDTFILDKVYDGNPVTIPSASDYTTTNSDVTVEWYNGDTKLTEAPVNVGEYKIKLIAKATDNYTEAVLVKDFAISKEQGTLTIRDSLSLDKKYDGKPVNLPKGSDYTTNAGEVTFTFYKGSEKLAEAPKVPGIYKIVFEAKGSENYSLATAEKMFTIEKGDVSFEFNSGWQTYTYSNAPVLFSSQAYETNSDGGISFTYYHNNLKIDNAINAGTYDVKVNISETDLYNSYEDMFIFVIQKREISSRTIKFQTPYNPDGMNNVFTITKEDQPGIFDDAIDLTVLKMPSCAGKFNCKFTANENYDWTNVTLEITVTKINAVINVEGNKEVIEKEYNGDYQNINDKITAVGGTLKIEYYNSDDKLMSFTPKLTGTYKVIVTVSGNVNYIGTSKQLTFVINKIAMPISELNLEAQYSYTGTYYLMVYKKDVPGLPENSVSVKVTLSEAENTIGTKRIYPKQEDNQYNFKNTVVNLTINKCDVSNGMLEEPTLRHSIIENKGDHFECSYTYYFDETYTLGVKFKFADATIGYHEEGVIDVVLSDTEKYTYSGDYINQCFIITPYDEDVVKVEATATVKEYYTYNGQKFKRNFKDNYSVVTDDQLKADMPIKTLNLTVTYRPTGEYKIYLYKSDYPALPVKSTILYINLDAATNGCGIKTVKPDKKCEFNYSKTTVKLTIKKVDLSNGPLDEPVFRFADCIEIGPEEYSITYDYHDEGGVIIPLSIIIYDIQLGYHTGVGNVSVINKGNNINNYEYLGDVASQAYIISPYDEDMTLVAETATSKEYYTYNGSDFQGEKFIKEGTNRYRIATDTELSK